MAQKKIGDSVGDKILFFVLDWILRPIVYVFCIYLVGAIILVLGDGFFGSHWVNTIPTWERWLVSTIIGLIVLWFRQEYKDNQHKDTF